MNIFLLSDNNDTLVGLRLVGIDGIVVHTKNEVLDNLDKLINNPDIAIILITTKLYKLVSKVITKLKLNQNKPLIIEVPDRHLDGINNNTTDDYIKKTIGIKI